MTLLQQQEPLRIAHVSLGLDMGGLEKLLVEFAHHTDRERFHLRFVSLTTRGALAGDLEACGWPVEAAGSGPWSACQPGLPACPPLPPLGR